MDGDLISEWVDQIETFPRGTSPGQVRLSLLRHMHLLNRRRNDVAGTMELVKASMSSLVDMYHSRQALHVRVSDKSTTDLEKVGIYREIDSSIHNVSELNCKLQGLVAMARAEVKEMSIIAHGMDKAIQRFFR